jgi:hypothetical protein
VFRLVQAILGNRIYSLEGTKALVNSSEVTLSKCSTKYKHRILTCLFVGSISALTVSLGSHVIQGVHEKKNCGKKMFLRPFVPVIRLLKINRKFSLTVPVVNVVACTRAMFLKLWSAGSALVVLLD